jgi:hypothetical protein
MMYTLLELNPPEYVYVRGYLPKRQNDAKYAKRVTFFPPRSLAVLLGCPFDISSPYHTPPRPI